MTTSPSPSPFAGVFASRKALLALFFAAVILVMVTGLEIAIVVLTIRGQMSIDSAIKTSIVALLGGLVTATPSIVAAINGWAAEDSQEKSRPVNVNATDSAHVEVNAPRKDPTP